jgi:N-acetylglucosamine malate deacetylase 1
MQVLELEKKINKILVVAAHPDDEILGCGGTVSKWSSQDKTIHTLIWRRNY